MSMISVPTRTRPENAALMSALEFTEADLDANRAGRLSPGQIEQRRRNFDYLGGNLARLGAQRSRRLDAFLAGFGNVMAALLVGLYALLQSALGGLAGPLVVLVALVVLGALTLSSWQYRLQLRRSQAQMDQVQSLLHRGSGATAAARLPVLTATGEIRTRSERQGLSGRDTVYHFALVDDLHLRMRASGRQVFKRGQVYRVYFVTEALQSYLLTAEAL